MTLLLRDQPCPKLSHQLLIYPTTDMTSSRPSMSENAEGCGLTRRELIWFAGHYVNTERDRRNPLASPLCARDHSRLPRTFIITAEHDPLRDEGEA